MSRLLLSVAFLFILVSVAWSQIEVRELTNISGALGKNLEAGISIKNVSGSPTSIIIKRVESVIGSTQKTWFCVGEECFDTDIQSTPLSIQIPAGETFSGFRSMLAAGLTEGFSRVKYIVYEKNNPSVEYVFEVNYTVEGKTISNALFSSAAVTLTDVYPNPVRDYAIFEYRISDPETTAKIVIHSVLGSIMGEYPLQSMDTNVKVKTDSFNPGVYFYSLYINDEGVMTRKLIVQK